MTPPTPSAPIADSHPKPLSAWYPTLPSAWNLGRVKSIARRITDGAHISPDTDGGVYDFVSTRDLFDGKIDFVNSLKTTPETYQYMVRTGCQPWDGDVLFSKDGTVGSTALVTGNHKFVVASSLVIITPDQRRLDSRFLQFVFASKVAKEQSAVMMRGAGLPRLSVGNLARIEIPIPPLDEQRQIVSFLTRATTEIDRLIAKQKRLIEVLHERREATITGAVLSENCTEVELRYLSRTPIENGIDEQSNHLNPPEWPRFIRTTDISGLTTLFPDKRVTVAPDVARAGIVGRGDILMTRAGATVGKAYMHDSEEVSCYAGYLVRWRVNTRRAVPKFMAYWTQSRHFRDQIATGLVKSTIENYSASKYRAMKAPVPPIDKQRRIAAYLDEQTLKIDALIGKAEEFIALARERRAALITEAVTGRIDASTGKTREGA